METNEAAAALLNMESPNNILDEKRMSTIFVVLLLLLARREVRGRSIFLSFGTTCLLTESNFYLKAFTTFKTLLKRTRF